MPFPVAVQTAYQDLLEMHRIGQPYGMTEFAIEDPDGYVITFAEPS